MKITALRAALLAPAFALLLSACSTAPTPQETPLAAAKARYAGEPYPVYIVDRTKFDPVFRPTEVAFTGPEPAGTLIVDTQARLLYLVEPGGRARRYGVAVGRSGVAWKGKADVARKAEWPAWYPTDDMHAELPGLPKRIAPGADNPLGARALYLYDNGRDTLYRIHGTSEPWTIGTEASSGCIRMFNEDVIDLYARVPVGTHVIVR